jgi:hypothetical protein
LVEHGVIGKLDNSYPGYQQVLADVLAMDGGKSGLDWVGQAHHPGADAVRGGRTWMALPDGRDAVETVRISQPLVNGLRTAHALLRKLGACPTGAPERANLARAPDKPYDRKLIRLAFLAPDIQRNILQGRQPAALTLERLMFGEIPASWEEQRRQFRM